MTDVLILYSDAQEYFEYLAPRFPEVNFHAATAPEQARDILASVDAIIARAHDLSRGTIEAAPRLKWIQSLTTGTDALTTTGVLPPHVLLTSTRGVHGPQMTELAFLYMLALSRNLIGMHANQAEGKWERWRQPILEGRTIVIVGLGILAEHLAARCKLFGMQVIGVSSGRSEAPNFDAVLSRERLREAAARADFLVLLVPYTKETHHLVNADVLAAMKPAAFLINIARGAVLDEDALVAHLQAGRIAGAGLDIFARQPLPLEHPLWRMPNVLITPNVGGHSDRFVEQTLPVLETNLRAFLDGRLEELRNLVPHRRMPGPAPRPKY
jgi:phosphoglycerate dehydrogenase-like enzyme